MKYRLKNILYHLKKDTTLLILTASATVGYLAIFALSRTYYNQEITIPSFITYIFIINTVLCFSVILKDKLTAHMLMSFNIIIQIISLICILKSYLR